MQNKERNKENIILFQSRSDFSKANGNTTGDQFGMVAPNPGLIDQLMDCGVELFLLDSLVYFFRTRFPPLPVGLPEMEPVHQAHCLQDTHGTKRDPEMAGPEMAGKNLLQKRAAGSGI